MQKKDRKDLKRFLKEVINLIIGKQVEAIADLLDSEKHVNEFIIAKKLDMTINQTRNILYKISDQGLVSFIRKKDKRKGWYTYFWKIEVLKSLEFLRDALVNKIEQINSQIKSRETKQFYICELCNVEYNEENALLRDFTCSECGNVFVLKDNTSLLKELKKNLDKLNNDLREVQKEIDQEKEKVGKKKDKENKKRDKDAKEKKQASRREAAKKRLETSGKGKKTPLKTKSASKKKVNVSKSKKIQKKGLKKSTKKISKKYIKKAVKTNKKKKFKK